MASISAALQALSAFSARVVLPKTSSARLRSVMSRAILEAPMMFPPSSRMGEMVVDILIRRPSLQTRMVS